MVKEYTRPAAGKEDAHPRELRPLSTLLKTVDYLIDSIVPRTDRPWNFVYDFVFDRMRAVRRDMVIQRFHGQTAITILEKIIRFLIYAGYRLSAESMSRFDPKINDTHAQECIKRLLVLYENADVNGRVKMGEFVALYLLYNAGSTEALLYAIAHKQYLRTHQEFKFALEISTSALLKNYVRVFHLCQKLSPMSQCALSYHIPHIQNEALHIMSAAFHSKGLRYNSTSLCELLFYDNEMDVREQCELRCLNVNDKGVLFNKETYSHIEKVLIRRYKFIDESLQNHSVPNLLHGLEKHSGKT